MHKHPLLLSSLFAALAAIAGAQSPLPVAQHVQPQQPNQLVASPGLFGPTGVLHDRFAETEWAAAASWKASFAPTGATFVPFLGSEAERNWPLAFAAPRARVAGRELPVAGGAVAQRDGQRVTYQRGGFAERYDLGPAGIEQSFCFENLPTRGELTIEVPVQTDLVCEPDGRGFRFQGPRGGVRYGAAVAIDAAGRRIDLTTQWRGQALQLSVPAEFVRTAALPLVVDPFVGTVTTWTTTTTPLLWPDVCYDPTTDVHVTCYEYVFSQTDSDVYLQRADGDLQALAGTTIVDVSTSSWRRPRIAGADIGDRELVVAEVSTGNVAPFKVAGRLYVDGTTASTAQFDIALNASRPDVGGDSRGMIPTLFLVAYEVNFSATDHDIYVRTVGSTGSLGTALPVDSSSTFEREPAVSKSNGTQPGAPVWGITYRRDVTATTGHVRAAVMNGFALTVRNGSTNWQVSNVATNTNASWSVSSVCDTGSTRTFLVAWTRNGTSGSGVTSTLPEALLFDSTGATLHGPFYVSAFLYGARGIDCDTDGLRFAVTWVESPWAGVEAINANMVAWNGTNLLSGDDNGPSIIVPVGSIPDDRRPSLAARQSGPFSARHAMVYGRLDNGSSTLNAVRYDAMAVQYGIPYGWTTRATGCGTLAIQHAGEGDLGSTATVSLPAPQGVAGFVAGVPTSLPIFACPGCTQGAQGPLFVGPSFSLNIPRDFGLLGLTVSFQGFDLVTSGAPCIGQIHLSDTLDMTVR